MKLRLLATLCIAAVVTAAGTAAIAGAARKAKTTVVSVADDYYSARGMKPIANGTLAIRTGDSLKWKWPELGDTHDVRIKRPLPKGYPGKDPKTKRPYKRLFSDDNPGGTYLYRFNLPGTYKIYCSFHSGEMFMTVKVTK
jgi:plastocyanin